MDILHSDWLVHMLEKSSNLPKMRLINMFDILDDWLDAPKLNAKSIQIKAKTNSPLHQFLSIEAAKAGATFPEMLANQIYFMAIAAAQEKVNHQNINSLKHAKVAAEALIQAQINQPFWHKHRLAVGLAAAGVVSVSIATTVLYQHTSSNPQVIQASTQAMTSTQSMQPIMAEVSASPAETAILFAKIEQMRKGECQLIEALQLPDSYKKVYFENIVLGQISTKREEQKLVHELLEKVRCNYTPMLMANSK
jgi:hypothetical protein